MKNRYVMDMERMRQSRFGNQLIMLYRDFIAEQSRIASFQCLILLLLQV
jgi:hypothetical protein